MNDVNLMAEASTFGPLEVIERDLGGVEAFLVPAGGDLSDDIGSLIIDRDDHTPEQMRAWARLFAAAPELLAKLHDVAAECSECAGTGKSFRYKNGERYEISCRDCDDIRKVIAKAEGRS